MKLSWCEWCKSYHSNKAEHIAREMWVLPPTKELFKKKSEAIKRGFGTANHRAPIKVLVKPI